MNLDIFNVLINNIRKIANDPELFLTNKYQEHRKPKGFRLELYVAGKYNSICSKIKRFLHKNFEITSIVSRQRKLDDTQHLFTSTRHSNKTFCPYCEKAVVPKRLHKLDAADIIIALLTAGMWAIFLLIMYLFMRKCPTCNYNLRGFKFFSEKKRR